MQQPLVLPCPKCGGMRVVAEALANRVAARVTLYQPRRNSGWGGSKNQSELRAFVCTNCGYAELYATEPNNLLPDP